MQTPRGSEILRNFAIEICGAQDSWVMKDFIQKEIVRIRKLVGDTAQVIGAVSGGVDSTVAAKLMKEAIGMKSHIRRVHVVRWLIYPSGDRFHAILVDNGMLP